MNITSPQINLPKINLLIVLFISYIMGSYKYGEYAHYFIFLIIIVSVCRSLVNGIKLRKELKINKMLLAICVILFSAVFIFSSLGIKEVKVFITNYVVICLIMIYGIVEFNKYGRRYGEQFFYQFTVIMNILSFANLYQVIFHKPFLAMLLTEKFTAYTSYAWGTSEFRTVAAFGHPIVCGLLFSLMFICNIYMIKGKYKYALQIIALINIYSTLSRSAWIALIIILFLYLIKNFRFKRDIFKLTYKKVVIFYFMIIMPIGFLIFKYNEIVSTISSRFGNSLSSKSTDLSNLQRTGTIDLIINHMLSSDIFHFLFGNGLGSAGAFMSVNTVVIRNFTTTDNMYLTFFFELGIISLVGYLLFLIISLYRLMFSGKSRLYELASLSFIFITIELFFFEGIGWGTVTTLWSFTLLTLLITFKSETVKV